MTGRQRKSAFVASNWKRLAGIPTPESGTWMLRDTPLDVSTLRSLIERGLVDKCGKVKQRGSRTGRQTMQQTYRTAGHDGVYEWFDSRVELPRSAFEAVSVRPDADVTVVDVSSDTDRTRELVEHVESLLRVDVQLVDFDVVARSSGEHGVTEWLQVVPDVGVVVTDDNVHDVVETIVDADTIVCEPGEVEFRRAVGVAAFCEPDRSWQGTRNTSSYGPDREFSKGQTDLTGEEVDVVTDGGEDTNWFDQAVAEAAEERETGEDTDTVAPDPSQRTLDSW